MNEINILKQKIEELPKGYISKKVINGKHYNYLQWNENGKIKSKYIKENQLEEIKIQIEKRKFLENKLKECQKLQTNVKESSSLYLSCNSILGSDLKNMTTISKNYEKRNYISILEDYLKNDNYEQICVLYGLRRTGKTMMIRQVIDDMPITDLLKCAYIKATSKDTMASLSQDLKMLVYAGYKYIFIDEITMIDEFIESASLISDVYAVQGIKFVLSGTDSLGFWLTQNNELYDRCIMIHTTYISYAEHSRLLKTKDIDEYIRYGGTLKKMPSTFENKESTSRYIDSAIAHNIQHSLECYEDESHFRHLYELYEKKELTGAINRIIEDINHRFLVSVLTRKFKSHDLSISAKNLRKEKDISKQSDILDKVDINQITNKLMEKLEIKNKENQKIGIKEEHVEEIKEYLKVLDLIVECPIKTSNSKNDNLENYLISQPGLRYSQVETLIRVLLEDEYFNSINEYEKQLVLQRILDETSGRLMEEIVLLETYKKLSSRYKVFKFQFIDGEFDMVIYDCLENTCQIYEIKHSEEIVSEQYRHLIDENKCQFIENKYGKIKNRIVIYRGKTKKIDNIEYINVDEYLNKI